MIIAHSPRRHFAVAERFESSAKGSTIPAFLFITILILQVLAPANAAPPTTQPAVASQPAVFEVHCDKPTDAVTVTADTGADRTIVTISSPSGIGGATLERHRDAWPKQLVLRVHLRGLESLSITTGDLKLSASVASNSGNSRTLNLLKKQDKDARLLTKASLYWMDILARDAHGKPVEGLPEADGYFEMVVPRILLDGNTGKLTIDWIDFYR